MQQSEPRQVSAAVATEDADLAVRLRTTIARLHRLLRQQDGEGFGQTLVATLATIGREGPISLGELAARERVAPPTITKIVERLVAEGFVTRKPDPEDRRIGLVSITSKGSRQLKTFRERRTLWIREQLAGLDADELEQLALSLPVLERLIEGPAT